jgi:hypothetical protein
MPSAGAMFKKDATAGPEVFRFLLSPRDLERI